MLIEQFPMYNLIRYLKSMHISGNSNNPYSMLVNRLASNNHRGLAKAQTATGGALAPLGHVASSPQRATPGHQQADINSRESHTSTSIFTNQPWTRLPQSTMWLCWEPVCPDVQPRNVAGHHDGR